MSTETERADKIINDSHDMSEWRSDIVTVSETSRFGKIRKCKKCDYEQVITCQGLFSDSELADNCMFSN